MPSPKPKWSKEPKTQAAREAKELVERPKRGRPPKRSRVMSPEEVRRKIQVSELLNVLHNVALSGKPIEKERLRAIEILLKKAIPDLKAIELSGNEDQPVKIILNTNVKRHLDQD